jgi:hypothetical protein
MFASRMALPSHAEIGLQAAVYGGAARNSGATARGLGMIGRGVMRVEARVI